MDAVAHPQSFAEITRKLADSQPDRVALSFEGRHTTYADLEKHTNQVANALIAAGIKKGDRIAYLGKNSDSYFEVFLGAGKMGGTTTPINWRLAGPEIVYILKIRVRRFCLLGLNLWTRFPVLRASAPISRRSSRSRTAPAAGRTT